MKNLLRISNLLFVFLLGLTGYIQAQTTLIDPNAGGGFELGSDFASNGWTVVNHASATNNNWFVGGTPVSFAGSNAAYISNTNGTTYGYDVNVASTSHFYRDVTVPAGETKINLQYQWKGNGEGTNWDRLLVYAAPISVTPVAGTPASNSSILTGATLVFAQTVFTQTTYTNANIFLPASLAGTTFRLIFTFQNDNGFGATPGPAVDNISLTSTVPGIFISINTGNWENPNTWDATAVPTAADNATVSLGHVVTVTTASQSINNLTVNGTLAYGATPTQFNVNGNLQVNAGGLVNVFNATTGKSLFVSGNITNNGRIDVSIGATTAGVLNLNGSAPQTISGSGIWGGTVATTTNLNAVGVIRNLTCSNTSTATPNITWSFDNIRIVYNLNLTGARVQLGTNKLIFGNYNAGNTLTAPAGTGFLPGGTFARWWAVASTGSAITTAIDPTNTTSRYPFLNTIGTLNRPAYITRTGSTTGNGAGELAVKYTDATSMTTGLSILDGAYSVTDRFDGNWMVSVGAGYVHNGAHTLVLLAPSAYSPLNGNSRILLAGAAAPGAHQNGTITPGVQRINILQSQLANTYYIGVNTLDNQYPCVGTPAPGNTLSSVSMTCPSVNFTLSLQNTTAGLGVTYQWQSSANGSTWANVATGGTSATYTANQAAASYYQCLVTCSGQTTASTPVQVAMDVPTNCYCTPAYGSGTIYGDLISNVSISGTTLSNNTGFVAGTPSYVFYTGQPNYTASLLPSSSYVVNVSTGEWGDEGVAAWIDYNDDGFFTLSERIGYTPTTIGSGYTPGVINASSSFNISLSCSPPAGVHRMRVRMAWLTNGINIDPCASYGYGETEDYLVTIVAAPACLSISGPLTTVSTTPFTANVSFPAGCATASNFDVEYGPVGFVQGTGTVSANIPGTVSGLNVLLTIPGLNPQTTYDYYVRANCGSGSTSSWVGVGQATTLDPPCVGTPNAPSAISSTLVLCANQTMTLEASGMSFGYSGITNIWEESSDNITWTPISGATAAIYQTLPLSAGTRYFRYASACSYSNATAYSNVITVTVNALPTINVSGVNNGTFCGVQALNASGAVSYTWAPLNVLNGSAGSTVSFIGSENVAVIATGTDANGCIGSSAPFAITYVAPTPVTYTSTVAGFCGTGGTTSIALVSTNTDYTHVFTSQGTGVISNATSSTFDYTVTETSSISVISTDNIGGCVAQNSITIGVNPLPVSNVTASSTSVCPGDTVTINTGLSAQNFSSTPIPFAALNAPSNAVTLVTGGVATTAPDLGFGLDDGGWSNIPVGFGFNFFGTNYTTVSIGTNGTMFMGNAGNVADFTFTTLPSVLEPFNMLAVLAMDHNLNGATGGTIKYWTEGAAPNRKFVVSYENIQEYGAAEFSTAQAILYETTGVAEVHVTSSTNVDRNKLVGINNGDGTEGVLAYASGFVASATNPIANPFAYRFSPPANFTTVWSATTNGVTTQLTTGTNIFSYDVVVNDTTLYSISYTNQTTGCQNLPGTAQIEVSTLGNVAPIVQITGPSIVCSGNSFDVVNSYTGLLNGLTFEWQVSTDNVTFAAITGATGSTLTTTQTDTSYYRLMITSCSGTPSYSDTLMVSMNIPTDCYCIPEYLAGTDAGDLISNVEILGTTLANNTGFVTGTPAYVFYTGQPNYTATLVPSTSYTLSISTGEWGDEGVAAWIDYNDDGYFDATELVGATTGTIGSGYTFGQINATETFPITISCTPPAGVHRMRVRMVYFENGVDIDPCSLEFFGETEDYLITIQAAPICPTPGILVSGTTTSTTALLNWNLNCSTASNFDFEYGPVGFVPGTGTMILDTLVTNQMTLTGLTPNSNYDIYYRANCGSGNVSQWSAVATFSTVCAPITLNAASSQAGCATYTLAPLTETVPSNNAGLSLGYYTGTGATGALVSNTITSTQTVYAYASAGTCVTEIPMLITINALPTVNAGVDQAVCINTPVTLNGAGAVSYTWTNNVTNATSFLPTTTATYTVDGVDANGCHNTDQVLVTVWALPTVNAGADQTICLSSPVTLSGSGALTYTWTNGVTNATPFFPTSTATYSVDGVDINGCHNTDQVVVTMISQPVVNAGLDQTVCATTPVVLFAQPTVNTPVSVTGYQWSNNIANGSQFTPTTTATYTVTATGANGCLNQDQVVVTVLALPNVNAGNDFTVCAGLSATLNATGAVSYSWNNGVTQATPFFPNATTTYTVTGTGANGCTKQDQVVVTVSSGPNVSVSGNQIVCANAPATLSAAATNSMSGYWSTTNGQGIISPNVSNGTVTYIPTTTDPVIVNLTYVASNACGNASQSTTVTVLPIPTVNAGPDIASCSGLPVTLTATGNGFLTWNNNVTNNASFIPATSATYTVTAVGANNCTNSDQMVLTLLALPDVNAGANQTVCSGSSVTLNAAGANNYVWNNGVVNNVSFAPTSTQTYTVTGTGLNGCQSSDQVSVTVNATPVALVSVVDEVTVSASPAGMNYQWINCASGTDIPSATSAQFTATANGSYAVMVTSLQGCEDVSDCITITTVGLDQVSITDMNVFPNPTNGEVNLSLPENVSVNVSIFDAQGKLVAEQMNVTNNGMLNIAHVTTGVYMVRLTSSNAIQTFRIVKN